MANRRHARKKAGQGRKRSATKSRMHGLGVPLPIMSERNQWDYENAARTIRHIMEDESDYLQWFNRSMSKGYCDSAFSALLATERASYHATPLHIPIGELSRNKKWMELRKKFENAIEAAHDRFKSACLVKK